MTIFLIVVSLYGGITTVPMNSEQACQAAADKFNKPLSRTAAAYCVSQ